MSAAPGPNVIASECNERGNLNKTEHLCFNQSARLLFLFRSPRHLRCLAMTGGGTASPAFATPCDDGRGNNSASGCSLRDDGQGYNFSTPHDDGRRIACNALRCHLRRPASSMRRPQPPQMNSPAILFSANRTPHKGYVIASECNERGNLNKTEHLCFNQSARLLFLFRSPRHLRCLAMTDIGFQRCHLWQQDRASHKSYINHPYQFSAAPEKPELRCTYR